MRGVWNSNVQLVVMLYPTYRKISVEANDVYVLLLFRSMWFMDFQSICCPISW